MAFISALALVLFVIVCFLLIVIILLQPGKGDGMAALGGMSMQMFGGGGATTFLAKLTTGLAVAYMVLVILLAKLSQPSARVEIPQPEAANVGASTGESGATDAAATQMPMGSTTSESTTGGESGQ